MFLNDHTHRTGISIHFEQLTIVERARRIACGHHRRDTILAGDDGAVTQHPACVGDDTPDAPMLRRAGLAIGVADAHPALLAAAHWVTKSNGGHGAVREVCDLLLSARGS